MKFLKYFPLFMFILLLNFNVYATNTNVSNKVKYSTSSSKGTYKGDEIYLGGYNGQFTIGTRYNGRLAMVSFYLNTDDYNFTTNHTYTITMNMATEDWRNNFMGPQVIEANSSGTLSTSLSTSNFRFVSYKQIKFNFKTDGSIPAYLFFRVYSTDYANPNGGSTAITGINNWKLSSIYINDNISSGGSSGGGSATPTPTPNTNQAIIDNQNKNTQDLIDNNNQNTTDIIENNNQNTQNVIDNQNELLGNKCPNLFGDYTIVNGWIYGTGMRVNENNGNRMAFIPIKPNTTYTITREILSSTFRVGEYTSIPEMSTSNVDYSLPKAIVENNDGRKITYTTGSTAAYLIVHYGNVSEDPFITQQLQTIQVVEGTEEKSFCVYGSYGSKMDELNDTIKDDNVDDKTGFFTGFSNDDHGLSSIITIPLTTIQQLTNTSCVALSVPIPYTNRSISLPCMTEVYQEHIPTIFNLWQIVSFGIIAYFICTDIFKMVKGFKDPNEDKVEVLDL